MTSEDFLQGSLEISHFYNEEGWEVEYSLECNNESCYRIFGTWSYGHWQL